MLERVRAHPALRPGASVVVGYSGGADSTCLLHLLTQLDLQLVAAHLHHGQRAEADGEQERCKAFADALGVPWATGRADVPALARDRRIGLEEAGREARYHFLESVRHATSSQWIATAHTRDDHLETVLLNLTRGCGLDGLAGIPASNERVIRPMLEIDRQEARRYCQERGFWFYDDPANQDVQFSRARVRSMVVPQLEAINPQVRQAVGRLARLAEEESAALDAMAAAALEQTETPPPLAFLTADCELLFDAAVLRTMLPVLVRRAVRLATRGLGGELEFDQAQLVTQSLRAADSGSITAPGGQVVIEWTSTRLHTRRLHPATPARLKLELGPNEASVFGWRLDVVPHATTGYHREPGSLDVVLSADPLQGELRAEPAPTGSRMRPLGMAGTKLLSDLFGEAGLTEAARRRLPVVWDLVGPVWAPGVAIDERVRVLPSTRRALRLTFGPLQDQGFGRGG